MLRSLFIKSNFLNNTTTESFKNRLHAVIYILTGFVRKVLNIFFNFIAFDNLSGSELSNRFDITILAYINKFEAGLHLNHLATMDK